MKRYYGNYLGIIIQNNDPEFRGRVKVWVPYVSATIYEGWNQERKDKKFKFLGKNIDSPISGQLLEELKNILPWAEYVAPALGSSGSGVYDSNKEAATISDSNDNSKKQPIAEKNAVLKKYRLNKDNVGEKSGKVFETDSGRVSDAFTDTANGVNKINVNAHNYKPSTYSNSAKGSFSIPSVGSHVMVFYMEGNPMHPYYFGISFGQDDFASVYNPSQEQFEDYPQSYENGVKKKGDAANVYRGKYAFIQKGGTIEIVNTDKRESIKFTHYSGSFKEYNNNTGIELLTNNNQKLVLGDEFNTVNGYFNSFIGRDSDVVVQGDDYRKIGKISKDLINQWIAAYQPIADIKNLFEIRRGPYLSPRYTGPAQTRSGAFGQCPTCGGSGSIFGDTCGTCGGSGLSPSTKDGSWGIEPAKSTLTSIINAKAGELAEIERLMGRGGNQIGHIAKHKIESVGLVLNKFNPIRVDLEGSLGMYAVTVATNGIYSQQKAFPIFEKVHVDDLPGGTFTHFIGNRYDAIVGAGGYRIKSLGNIDISGAVSTFIGDQVIIGSSNEVALDGGKRLNLTADSIQIKSRLGKQIAFDGNLGVTKNVVIGGGMHVDGELSVQHITAPLEFQVTEPVRIKTSFIIRGMKTTGLQQIGDSGDLNQNITDGILEGELELLTDHTHYFRNVPLKLVDGNAGVRDDSKAGVNTDSLTPRLPYSVEDGRKGDFQPTVTGPDNGPPPNT